MAASSRGGWRAAIIAACGIALFATGHGFAQSRPSKTPAPARKPVGTAKDSRSPNKPGIADDLADDDSIKGTSDNAKDPKKTKKKAKSATPAEPSRRLGGVTSAGVIGET